MTILWIVLGYLAIGGFAAGIYGSIAAATEEKGEYFGLQMLFMGIIWPISLFALMGGFAGALILRYIRKVNEGQPE